ncbi:MAG: hypothetical protein HYU86_02885 [Chloroflexi bacterium]|nr:hypothetical protein [Chloroflexota bacterium]
MLCSGCGQDNPQENRYCGHCGIPLVKGQRVVTLKDILDEGILKEGATVSCKLRGQDVFALLKADGTIDYKGTAYPSPMDAIQVVRDYPCDGWNCWHTDDPQTGRNYPIAHFRGAWRRLKGG